MKKDFDQLTHLGQSRKLRQVAIEALKQYPIKNFEIKFVNHGENTTFKIITKQQSYLFRIHCRSHRTKPAMLEELKWLDYLAKKTNLPIQQPIRSINNQLILSEGKELLGHDRYCDLLKWQDGRILNNKNPHIFYKVGVLAGILQSNTIKSKHRHYWNAEGLVGENAVLGPLSGLRSEFPKQFNKLEPMRKKVFLQLRDYEKKNPQKIGLIHSDLHFGNMVWEKGIVKPIDFDDCGVGFQMNDLAVTLAQSSNYFKRIGKKESAFSKGMLLEGYSQHLDLTQKDIDIIPYIVASRGIAMLGWLWGRRDNPMLYDWLKKEIPNYILKIQRNLKQAESKTYF